MLTNGSARPSLLELKKQPNGPLVVNAAVKPPPPPLPQRTFNKAYVNPNARQAGIDKHQRDLQRQHVQLGKLQASFQEEIARGHATLGQAFAQLARLLAEKQAEAERALAVAGQTGLRLLAERQAKVTDLKHLADNVLHLSDHEIVELKADIKVDICDFYS
jgi:hypothetical protein